MKKPLVKLISFWFGALAPAIAALFFVVAGDTMLTIQSVWLMIVILLAFGGVACLVLSENYKEKKKILYALKSIAIGLTVGAIVFFVVYLVISLSPAKDLSEASSFVQSFAINRIESKKDYVYTSAVVIVSLVVSVIGVAGQALNLIMTAKIKEE